MSTGLTEPFLVVQPLGKECLEQSSYARIVSINDDVMIVSIDDHSRWSIDDRIAISYLDFATDEFLQAPGCIQRLVDPEPNPTFELAVLDDFETLGREAQAILREAAQRSSPTATRLAVPLAEHLDHPLPGSILDERGHILRRKGQVLTREDIRQFGRLNLKLGDDWWPANPNHLPAESKDSTVAESNSSEGRTLPLDDWITDATVHVLETGDVRRFTVTTHAISPTAISFFSPFYLAVGLRLSVRISRGGKEHRTIGLVKSCVYQSTDGEGTHDIELAFDDDAETLQRFLDAVC